MMTCKRCRCIMYPYSSGSSLNHKPGYCSDGAPVKGILEPVRAIETPDTTSPNVIPWPQPEGIFTTGNRFHPIPFLQAVRNLYQRLVEERLPCTELEIELQAFVTLYARQSVMDDEGNHLFRLPNINIDPSGNSFIVEYRDAKHLRVDCLRDAETIEITSDAGN